MWPWPSWPLPSDLWPQVEDPYCSQVSQLVLENTEGCVGFTLSGVPTDKLAGSKNKWAYEKESTCIAAAATYINFIVTLSILTPLHFLNSANWFLVTGPSGVHACLCIGGIHVFRVLISPLTQGAEHSVWYRQQYRVSGHAEDAHCHQ